MELKTQFIKSVKPVKKESRKQIKKNMKLMVLAAAVASVYIMAGCQTTANNGEPVKNAGESGEARESPDKQNELPESTDGESGSKENMGEQNESQINKDEKNGKGTADKSESKKDTKGTADKSESKKDTKGTADKSKSKKDTSEHYDGADMQGKVVQFTDTGCQITPAVTEKAGEGEIMYEAAPGFEDLSELVEITYGEECEIEIITCDMSSLKEVSRVAGLKEDIKKGTEVLIYGECNDTHHWTAQKVAIFRWQ